MSVADRREPALAPEPAFLPNLTVSKVILGTLVVLSVGGGFWILFRFAAVFFTLFMAMVLGTALRPGLEWFNRLGFSRSTSAVLVHFALVTLLVGFFVLLMPLVMGQASATATKLPGFVESVRQHGLSSSSSIIKRIALELPRAETAAATVPLAALTGAQAFAGSKVLGSGVITVLAVLLLGFYWSLEGEVAVRALVLFLKPEQREPVREFVEAAEAKVGDYVRGQLVVCLVTTALAIVAFTLLGLPSPLVLALIAGAMGAVPIFGAPLGFLPAVFMAASVDSALVPWVVGAGVVIHVMQDYVIAPRVMRHSVGVHPFVVFLAISGFGSFLGVAGAILAIPMAAILQLLLDRFVFDPDRRNEPVLAGRDRLGVLRLEAKRLALDVRRQGRDKGEAQGDLEDPVEEMVESIANELDAMLAQQGAAVNGAGRARRA
jgi:predicted PurR-regulated permease PerM